MIELSLTTIILTTLVGLMGSSGVTTLILYVLNRKKSANEVTQTEASGLENLLEKIKVLVNEKIDDVSKNQALQTQVTSLQTVVGIRDAEIKRQGDTIKEILVEQGKAHERENQCQANLREIQKKLSEFEDLHQINIRLVKDNLLMQGAIDEKGK